MAWEPNLPEMTRMNNLLRDHSSRAYWKGNAVSRASIDRQASGFLGIVGEAAQALKALDACAGCLDLS